MRYSLCELFKSAFGESIDMMGFEMAIAHFKDGRRKIIRIDQAIEQENEIQEFFCPVCGRNATIRHNVIKDPCFFSRWHKPNCQLYLSHSKKKKTSNIVIGKFIDLKKAIRPNHKLTKKARKFLNYKNGIVNSIAKSSGKAPKDVDEDDRSQTEVICAR